jgi:hypothetical protein
VVVVALTSVPVPVPGLGCNWEWERKRKLLAALARTHDTILRTLSLRRTARAGSALLGRLERLYYLALGRTAELPCRDGCLVVVRFWESTVCLGEIQIDPAIHGGVWIDVDGAVDSVDVDGETVVVQGKILDPEVEAAFVDRSSPTSRCCAVSMSCRDA